MASGAVGSAAPVDASISAPSSAAAFLGLRRLSGGLVVVPAAVRAVDHDDADQRCGGRDGRRDDEEALQWTREAPRLAPLGEGGEHARAALVRELERRSRAQRGAAGLEPPHVLGARPARDEVLGNVLPRVGRQLLLDVGEQLEFVRVLLGHHWFDSVSCTAVPRRSASSLRPRKMRDFTVPSATPVISAISAYEQPSTS